MFNRDRKLATSLLIRSARAASRAGQYEDVIRLLTLVLVVLPSDSSIYHNRGLAYMHLQRYDEALADFNQAIAHDQFGTAKFYEQRGIAYFEKCQMAQARDDWEYAASIDSGATVALLRLGSISLEEKRYPRAIDYFSRAIAAEPTLATAFVSCARAHLAMGQTSEAFEYMRMADDLVVSGRDTSNGEQEM